MTHVGRVAWTIARRDYAAAVFSRLFLLFLCLPVILIGLALVFGTIGAGNGGAPPHATLAVPAGVAAGLRAARARLAARLGEDALPAIVVRPDDAAGVLTGPLDRPRLRLAADAPDDLADDAALILDTARAARAAGGTLPSPVRIAVDRARAASGSGGGDRTVLARGVQYAILMLTVMLAGRLLSSFIEERSNKVIELLAAAVPVDAIFLGKLLGMLMFSLTCVGGWAVTLLAGIGAFAPGLLAGLPVPAVGWPMFALLGTIYFALAYGLFGAVMLGLGAQTNSPADVQTLALPTTIAQILPFGLASIDVARPDHWVALAAAILPWSSALALAARAAETPALWPHALGIAWQAAWLWLTIRLAAARFRRAVLKSGPARRRARS